MGYRIWVNSDSLSLEVWYLCTILRSENFAVDNQLFDVVYLSTLRKNSKKFMELAPIS